MKILIDADACPVTRIAVEIAKEFGLECILFCDTSHIININYATTVIVSKGNDSADFALVNKIIEGDIAITQDYGLASMCLGKKAFVINQNGLEYTNDNIVYLMESRYESHKLRRSGKHQKGPKPRNEEQDKAFISSFRKLILREIEKMSDITNIIM